MLGKVEGSLFYVGVKSKSRDGDYPVGIAVVLEESGLVPPGEIGRSFTVGRNVKLAGGQTGRGVGWWWNWVIHGGRGVEVDSHWRSFCGVGCDRNVKRLLNLEGAKFA